MDIVRLAAVTWLLLSALLIALAAHETAAIFDRALREHAGNILAFSAHELAEIRAGGGPPASDRREGTGDAASVYQIWHADGTLAYRSAKAPEIAFGSAVPGFGDAEIAGAPARTFTAWNDDHTFQIRIATSLLERKNYLLWVSMALSLSLLAAFAAFVMLVRRQLDRGFAPLESIAQRVADRSTDDLSAIETPRELPEIEPVIDAFNKLMARVDRSVRQERRFANDAAHSLRTPLSSLKILIGNVQRARDMATRDEALAMMGDVVDRSSGLVNQLLHLARFDREPGAVDLSQAVDLVALAQSVVTEFTPLGAERGLFIGRTGAAGCVVVRGNHAALSVALRSLIENAVSFVPRYGTVLVEVVRETGSDTAMIRVHDDGPGVEKDLQDRVFSLFFKVDRSDTANAGLGLPLVARIAQVHRGLAYVGVSTLLGGAMAVVRLPCATSASSAADGRAPASAQAGVEAREEPARHSTAVGA